MIRKMRKPDIDAAADIWLEGNLSAHNFVPEEYWKENLCFVKEMLAEAEVYVYENDNTIYGFTGLDGEHIEGIFVSGRMRRCGIGKALLDHVKGIKGRLTLNVYVKNTPAISFYTAQGFTVCGEGTDGDTGEKDYVMMWEKP